MPRSFEIEVTERVPRMPLLRLAFHSAVLELETISLQSSVVTVRHKVMALFFWPCVHPAAARSLPLERWWKRGEVELDGLGTTATRQFGYLKTLRPRYSSWTRRSWVDVARRNDAAHDCRSANRHGPTRDERKLWRSVECRINSSPGEALVREGRATCTPGRCTADEMQRYALARGEQYPMPAERQ